MMTDWTSHCNRLPVWKWELCFLNWDCVRWGFPYVKEDTYFPLSRSGYSATPERSVLRTMLTFIISTYFLWAQTMGLTYLLQGSLAPISQEIIVKMWGWRTHLQNGSPGWRPLHWVAWVCQNMAAGFPREIWVFWDLALDITYYGLCHIYWSHRPVLTRCSRRLPKVWIPGGGNL